MGKKFTCTSCGEEKWWQLVGLHENATNALCQDCTDQGKALDTKVANIYKCVKCRRVYKENPGLCPKCKQRVYETAPSSMEQKEKSRAEFERKKIDERNRLRMRMANSQNNICAICLTPNPDFIDHDHKTGYIRGLLCPSCNTGIGFLGDNFENLLRAAEYLQNPPFKEKVLY